MSIGDTSRVYEARSQPMRLNVAGTSLSTSRIGVGTHALHRLLRTRSRQGLLNLAYDTGVRYFDTAPSYGAGIAELELGRFAAGRRSELVLTTKFGITTGRLAAHLPGWLYAQMALRLMAGVMTRVAGVNKSARRAPVRDFSATRARASVEESLRRLRTDHVDVLYLHEPTLGSLGDTESLLRALEDLKAAGKVRYFGLSGEGVECARIARAHPPLAQILQAELVPSASARPELGAAPRAAVRFWEFSAPRGAELQAGRFAQTLQLAREVPSDCVLVLSTDAAEGLRKVFHSL